MKTEYFLKICVVVFLIFLIGCQKEKIINIDGSGASFPYPFYSKIFKEFNTKNTNVLINYRSVGSGSGIKDIKVEIVDFAGSDVYLKDKELNKINSYEKTLLHVPTCIGSVVMAYNLPIKNLKLDGKTIAKIFMGEITKWNHPSIAKMNQGQKLPNEKIIPMRRADSSGSTFIFSDYLSKNSVYWKNKMGKGKSLQWDRKIFGQKGNEGVTAAVKRIKNSIGYINLNYAVENKLKIASIKNKEEKFIYPNIQEITVSGEISLPNDLRVMLTSGSGYPISGFTWILFYQEQKYNNKSLENAKFLYNLLKWTVTKGQKYAASLYYAPLSPKAQKKSLEIIETMTYGGELLKNL